MRGIYELCVYYMNADVHLSTFYICSQLGLTVEKHTGTAVCDGPPLRLLFKFLKIETVFFKKINK